MAENPLRTVTPTQLLPRAGDRGGRGEGHRRALGHGRARRRQAGTGRPSGHRVRPRGQGCARMSQRGRAGGSDREDAPATEPDPRGGGRGGCGLRHLTLKCSSDGGGNVAAGGKATWCDLGRDFVCSDRQFEVRSAFARHSVRGGHRSHGSAAPFGDAAAATRIGTR